MKKKWLLLLIIALPSIFWLLLELSTINSKRLPFFGPRSFDGKDTVYFKGNDKFYPFDFACFGSNGLKEFTESSFCLLITDKKYRSEGYRVEGLLEYMRYKSENLKDVPIAALVSREPVCDSAFAVIFDYPKGKNVRLFSWPKSSYDSLRITYFVGKPSYVDYSFMILLDRDRHIRGYYDTRYAAEMKRMLDEYKHLRLKEEKKEMIKKNEIKDNNQK